MVLRAQFLKQLTDLYLAHLRRYLVVTLKTDALWNLGIEFVKALYAHLLHHHLQIILGMGKILIIH